MSLRLYYRQAVLKSWSANKLDQAGIGFTERQQAGSRLTDYIMVPVLVPAPLVFTGCCAQVCRFLRSAYNYTLLTKWLERLSLGL
jgi:hypothetical protein